MDLVGEGHLRAGILPYILEKGTHYYAFGISFPVNNITYIGGGICADDGDILETALREYKEESLGVFGALSKDSLCKMEYIKDKRSVLFLHQVKGNLSFYVDKFQNLEKSKKHELKGIIWLTKKQITVIIRSQNFKVINSKVLLVNKNTLNLLKENLDRLK